MIKEGKVVVKTSDAIRIARGLLGTPYAQLDCINLIKKVIRDAPGGVKGYTTAGTNALWDSYDMSAKYRDLTWRQTGLSGAQAGMLAFKAKGEDYHHIGIVTDEETVIHSSSAQGGRGVVQTPLTAAEGWTHLAMHRHIEVQWEGGETPKEESMEKYQAIVTLNDPESSLNVRSEPGKSGKVINKLHHGQRVMVLEAYGNGWAFVEFGENGKTGHVSMNYLVRDESQESMPDEASENEEASQGNVPCVSGKMMIIDSEGNEFFPVGGWRVEMRLSD